jgi:hypothetical protein
MQEWLQSASGKDSVNGVRLTAEIMGTGLEIMQML